MLEQLIYRWNETDYAANATGLVEKAIVEGAYKALGIHFGLPGQSIQYLLQNGWSQSLQDAYAGARAKAINDGESDETVTAVVEAAISKRIIALKEGKLLPNVSGGRDPVRSTAKAMLEATLVEEGHANFGKKLPKDKTKLKLILDKYIEKHLDAIKAEIAKKRAMKSAEEVSLDDLEV